MNGIEHVKIGTQLHAQKKLKDNKFGVMSWPKTPSWIVQQIKRTRVWLPFPCPGAGDSNGKQVPGRAEGKPTVSVLELVPGP